jgi:hypothetical protein
MPLVHLELFLPFIKKSLRSSGALGHGRVEGRCIATRAELEGKGEPLQGDPAIGVLSSKLEGSFYEATGTCRWSVRASGTLLGV